MTTTIIIIIGASIYISILLAIFLRYFKNSVREFKLEKLKIENLKVKVNSVTEIGQCNILMGEISKLQREIPRSLKGNVHIQNEYLLMYVSLGAIKGYILRINNNSVNHGKKSN